MRYLLSASLSLLAVASSVVAQAEEVAEQVASEAAPASAPVTSALISAQQDFLLAQLRWQQYRFVELPRQRQILDDQIRLMESELDVLQRRVRDYRPFLQVGRYSPARTAAENDRLALQVLQQQLRLVRSARINLMRTSRSSGQLYQLEVLRTAARVREVLAKSQLPLKK